MANYKIAKSKNGKMLLTNMGKIALAGAWCLVPDILIRTDALQHPHCIDFTLSDNRSFYPCDVDSSLYSAGYKVDRAPGNFILKLRWKAGHTPYPEIKNMEVWAFGVYLGNLSFPLAPNDYSSIAHIVIDSDRKIYVNGYLC